LTWWMLLETVIDAAPPANPCGVLEVDEGAECLVCTVRDESGVALIVARQERVLAVVTALRDVAKAPGEVKPVDRLIAVVPDVRDGDGLKLFASD
jgi:hypothetical protein